MKVREFIENTIDEIQERVNEKEFILEQLFRKVDVQEKEIALLRFKQEIYKNYLKNGRRVN